MCGTTNTVSPVPTSPTQCTEPAPPTQFSAEEEAELKILREIQSKVFWNPGHIILLTPEQQEEVDRRTIFVGNVDFGTTMEEIEELFDVCGKVKVEFQTDRFTGRRKNHCFVELADASMVSLAIVLDQVTFRNRRISVKAKIVKKSP